ncbi:MAG: DUF3576 domain-containing protein [Alphaproteobacteria bacterium]|nr:DUF3576 domain-containing protein [Alphaproteobacteria bacterium]
MLIARILAPAAFLSLFLAACTSGTESTIQDREERERDEIGQLFGDDFLEFGGDGDGGADTSGGGVAVNGFLWRASLDTISFFPLTQADPFGGVIITDWYTPPETPNSRFKLNVFILGRQLRADGLRVSAFKQERNARGEWVDTPIANDTVVSLENAILTRAREIRISSLAQPD